MYSKKLTKFSTINTSHLNNITYVHSILCISAPSLITSVNPCILNTYQMPELYITIIKLISLQQTSVCKSLLYTVPGLVMVQSNPPVQTLNIDVQVWFKAFSNDTMER